MECQVPTSRRAEGLLLVQLWMPVVVPGVSKAFGTRGTMEQYTWEATCLISLLNLFILFLIAVPVMKTLKPRCFVF